MGAIFISHSSHDNDSAQSIRAQLTEWGYESVFLDVHPDDGIHGGEEWEQALYRELRACRVLIALCSRNFATSQWCFTEIAMARAAGKTVIPVRMDQSTVGSGFEFLLNDRQCIDLFVDRQTGYKRLRNALECAGLDRAEAYRWQANRPPYPGLRAFEEDDAAAFYGRDDDVDEACETLTRLRRQADRKLTLILGASGCGKSSLVRAGVVPRLRRDPKAWCVVPPFRPSDGPWDLVLARALANAFPVTSVRHGKWRTAQRALRTRARARLGANFASLVFSLLTEHQDVHGVNEGTVVLVVDQLEEIFGGTSPEQANALLSIFKEIEASSLPLLVLATFRSDLLQELQTHSIGQTLSLKLIPLKSLDHHRFAQVIERPAERAGIQFETGLIQQLIADTETPDALPMLAFTLSEMYRYCASDRKFTFDIYNKQVGGICGAVARKAEAVLAAIEESPETERALKVSMLKMVRINDEGIHVRWPAEWAALPPAAHPLIKELISSRLLVTQSKGTTRTIEVAHEALFRQWRWLNDLLMQNQRVLMFAKRFQADRETWTEANHNVDYLLRGARLVEAAEWARADGVDLGIEDRQFLEASAGQVLQDYLKASPSQILALAESLAPLQTLLAPRLRMLAKSPSDGNGWRAALALLPIEPSYALNLGKQLLRVDADEFLTISTALVSNRFAATKWLERLQGYFWRLALARNSPPVLVFRAGCALAALASDDRRWPRIARAVAEQFIRESPLSLESWIDTLRPVGRHLRPYLRPWLEESNRENYRQAAALALVDAAKEDVESLAEMAAEAAPDVYDLFFNALLGIPRAVVKARVRLAAIAATQPSKQALESERVAVGRRRAGAAITLLRLGQAFTSGANQSFRAIHDLEAISQFGQGAAARHLGSNDLGAALERTRSDMERFGLLLALGEFPADVISGALLSLIRKWYRTQPASGVHGACGWLLRRWGRGGEFRSFPPRPYFANGRRDWFVMRVGGISLTFAVFRPGVFTMGSRTTEAGHRADEVAHRARITRPFALCVHPVTVRQLDRFDRAKVEATESSDDGTDRLLDHPVNLSWTTAIDYCRWLTARAGGTDETMQACGPLGPDGQIDFHPERCGFRLPTEAEWEYACRSGTTTSFSFGSDRRLLEAYCGLQDAGRHGTCIVGTRRPNPRGLFDMHGNVYEWCYDWKDRFGTGMVKDPTGPSDRPSNGLRVLRGGGWSEGADACRSAARHGNPPSNVVSDLGLRVALTLDCGKRSGRGS